MPIAGSSGGTAQAVSGTPSSVVNDLASAPSQKSGEKLGPLAAIAIPGVISGVMSFFSSLIQNAQTRKNMDKQAATNLAQWNRENAYNDPSAQMARFAGAGLNPDLIYGQSNTAGSATLSTDAPTAANPNLQSSVQAALNAQLTQSQVELNKSAAARNYADADVKPSLGEYYKSGSTKNLAAASLYAEEENTQRQAQAKMLSEIDNLNARTANEWIKNHHLDAFYEAQIHKMLTAAGLDQANAKLAYTKCQEIIKKLPYEIEYLQSASDKNEALAAYYNRVKETLYTAIWDALAYKSGISFDEYGNASFATNGAKWMSTATQGAERGTKVAKDIVSMIMEFQTGATPEEVEEIVDETANYWDEYWSKTTNSKGETTKTHSFRRRRPPMDGAAY